MKWKEVISEPRQVARGRPRPGLMFGLSLADLRHERVLNLCIVLALTAVLAPLLILFGLKHGAIQMMRNRLIEDPRNREIRPIASLTLDRDWFEAMRDNPQVGFVTPMTRRIAAGVAIRPVQDSISQKDKEEVKKLRADLIPTGAGDALLTRNNAPIPGPGECVLSMPAAKDCGVETGDLIEVLANRLVRGRNQTVFTTLKVIGVADGRASSLDTVFTPLAFLEQVERYKDGLAVPELGWDGSLPEAYPVFDGAAFTCPEALPRTQELGLVLDTGFTKIDKVPPEELQELGLGHLRLTEADIVYLLATQASTVPQSAIKNLGRETKRLGAKQPVPWIRHMSARWHGAPEGQNQEFQIIIAPGLSEETPGPAPAGTQPLPVAALPASAGVEDGRVVDLSIETPSGPLSFPALIRVPPSGISIPKNCVALPPEIAGILRLAQTRSISYKPDLNRFVLARRGYSSFRLYAKTIDDVPLLASKFENMGISVFTEAERIRDVREIDTYATYVFLLIASVGVIGSTAALMANLYAAVERTRKELSVLRLLGVARASLLRFPIYQATALVTAAITTAASFFYGIAAVINHYFQELLAHGERVCHLPPAYLAAAWIGGIVFATLASIFAAARIAGIDPSEALRDE